MTGLWLLGAAALLAPGRPSPGAVRLAHRRAKTRATPRLAWTRWIDPPAIARRPVVAVTASLCVGAALAVGAELPVALGLALVAALVADEIAASAARSHEAAAERGVASALEVLSAELAAGSREPAALIAAADAGGRTARCLADAARLSEVGADPGAAFRGSFEGLAGAWHVRAMCGTPLAHVVAAVGDDLAARVERRRALDSALAGPRASGAMLAVLPVLGLVLGAAMGAHPLSFLLGAGRGSLVLLAGIGLEVGGWCWIRALLGRALR